MEEALKLITAKSPMARRDAGLVMRLLVLGSKGAGQRYQSVLVTALADPEADFTAEEKQMLVRAGGSNEQMTAKLSIVMTETERAKLESMAAEARLSMSKFVRQRLFA